MAAQTAIASERDIGERSISFFCSVLLRRARFTAGPSLGLLVSLVGLLLGILLIIFRQDWIYFFAVDHGIGRIDDYFGVCIKARKDFNFGAKIASEGNRNQLGLILRVDRGDLQTLRAEDQRADRKDKRGHVVGKPQVHFGIGAGKKFAGCIVDVDFDQQGARS